MFLTIQHVFEKLHIRFLAAGSEECFFRTEQNGMGFPDYITPQRIEKGQAAPALRRCEHLRSRRSAWL
jgi:hypothetical protein